MSIVARISRHFRQRRMRRFAELMGVDEETRILDVGGSPDTWRLLPFTPRVTLLNIPMSIEHRDRDFHWVAGDGCALPFASASFDIVFSNSVIEHVGDAARQRAFAQETMRVGRRYFVQTPNAGFPVEQHLFMPFLHWLPNALQRKIVERFTVWERVARPRPDQREFYLRHYLDDVRLLRGRGLRALFPGAQLRKERVLGIAKSLIAIGR
ncbi:MAG: methyltransferase domain-containing protein [Bryobacterales bacterium]|nr:methyltransferase domain-containing protein [Bryobacterales bacterium]